MNTNILEINEDDLEITLIDGSVWQLSDIGDFTKICLWYPPQRIKIDKTDSKQYFLTNLDTFTPDKIKVVRLG